MSLALEELVVEKDCILNLLPLIPVGLGERRDAGIMPALFSRPKPRCSMARRYLGKCGPDYLHSTDPDT